MKAPLRLLHLEDNLLDAELCSDLLESDGLRLEITRAKNASEFHAALAQGGFDVILADYSLPDYDGNRALARVREDCPGVPFIFVSGELGEEAAIAAMKNGATDYVLKMRLSRLAPAVRRAVAEAGERREHLRAEQALRERDNLLRSVLASVSAHIAVVDSAGVILAVNRAWQEFSEKNSGSQLAREGVGMSYLDVCRRAAPESPEAAHALKGIEGVLRGTTAEFVMEYPCHAQAEQRWFLLYATPLTTGRNGAVLSHVDITERKRAELERAALHQRLRQVEKFASLGQLAASVVSEMTTPGAHLPTTDPFEDFNGLLQNFEKLLDAARGEAAPPLLIAEAEAARAQVNERVVFNLCKLLVALADSRQSGEAMPPAESPGAETGDQPRLLAALQETIEVLEGTKHSFKSKALGQLRAKLQAVLRSGR